VVLPASSVVWTVSGVPIELSVGEVEGQAVDRQIGEAHDLAQGGEQRRVLRQRRDRALDDRAGVPEAQQRDVVAEELEVPAVQHPPEVGHRDSQHLLGHGLLDLTGPGGDRLLGELALERILRVEDQLDRRVAGALRDQGVELADDVGRDDQRGLRLAALDLVDRLRASGHPDRIDRLEQLIGVLGDADLLVCLRSARPRQRCGSRTRSSSRDPRGPPMNPHSRSRWRGSSDADGSSRSSAGGSHSRPIAMFTRCWLPPERRPTSSSARSSRPVWASIAATAWSGSETLSSRANSRRFSATDGFEYSAGSCGTHPKRLSGARATSPSLGSSAPARIDSSVVLPAPLGPMIATTSPG
jgi:hypothetical protein